MVTSKLTLQLFLLSLIAHGSTARTRYQTNMNSNASDLFKTRNDYLKITQDPIAVTKSPLYEANTNPDSDIAPPKQSPKLQRRSSFAETSTFNPDVLNKFLEEYASKMKPATDKPNKHPFAIVQPPADPFDLEFKLPSMKFPSTSAPKINSTKVPSSYEDLNMPETANDTLERNKNWNNGPQDDHNGWVTLEAIPWSKSKISKWQANENNRRPWPDQKPWEKPHTENPISDYSSRPNYENPSSDYPMRPNYENPTSDYPMRPNYENNRPWQDRPKPYATSARPWYQSDQESHTQPSRPSYFDDNKFDSSPSYAQKWPPERPWNKYSESSTPSSDIIIDNKPSNFPGSWDKPQTPKPSYIFDRFPERGHSDDVNNWKVHDYKFPSHFAEMNDRPSNNPRPSNNQRPSSFDRPHFSRYRYTTEHPSSHPSTGDGQWVLLSTNSGYSKSRQRSIKIDAQNPGHVNSSAEKTDKVMSPPVEVMTSKRQVRLTVLPPINGTNTTMSHGGLLEVEKTFKTVDQSHREFERRKKTQGNRKRPIRNTLTKQPTNQAVLAAVGAGMLPATMAMVIPMMLGRKKRSMEIADDPKKSLNLEVELEDMADRLNDRKKMKILRM